MACLNQKTQARTCLRRAAAGCLSLRLLLRSFLLLTTTPLRFGFAMSSERSAPLAQTAAIFAGGLAAGVGSVFLAQKALTKHAPVPSLGPVEYVERAAPRTIAPARAAAPAQTKAKPAKLTTPAPSSQTLSSTDFDNATVVGATGVEQPHPAAQAPKKHAATHASLVAERIDATAEPSEDAPLWAARPLSGSTAVGLVEREAYYGSDAVFVYDSDATAFGRWVEAAGQKDLAADKAPRVYSLQTRAGAATAVLGYLSGTSTSAASSTGLTASILTNAQGLVTMAPALAFAQTTGRIVAQVSSAGQAVSGTGEGSVRLADNAPSTVLAASLLAAGEGYWSVIYTSDQTEAADVATAAYKAATGNVAHIFDGVFAGREVDQALAPAPSIVGAKGDTVLDVLAAAKWSSFAYTGPAKPEVVLVVPNTSVAAAAKLAYTRLSKADQAKTAVLAVRIVRPWDEAALLAAVPASTQRVVVLDLDQGALASDVEAAFFDGDVDVSSLPAPTDASAKGISAALQQLIAGPTTWAKSVAAAQAAAPPVSSAGKLLTVLDTESSATTHAGQLIARVFADAAASGVPAARALSCRALQRFDNFHGPEAAGVVRSDLVFGPRALPIAAIAQDGQAQTVVLAQAGPLTAALDALALVAPGGTVLIDTSGWDAPAAEVLSERLAPIVQRTIAALSLQLVAIDAAGLVAQLESATAAKANAKAKQVTLDKELASAVLAIAALRVHLNATPTTLATLARPTLADVPGIEAEQLAALAAGALAPVAYDPAALAAATEEGGKSVPVLPAWEYTGFSRLTDRAGAVSEPVASTASWASAAWQKLYPEAYDLKADALRADLAPEKLWEVEVTENRRLTPLDYDRNVFHLEMSTKGTDLTYQVGEALGVHGWNDEAEVRDFISWTGFQPDEVVSVPAAGGKAESLTVFQLLLQRKDIFGRPGKSFYAVLADKAADTNEAKWLRFVASAEGNSTFKKYAEVETVTYADVLRMFPSVLANLTVQDVLTHIEDIQPRHYSIASAQAAVGESVHLLIVTVDWQTPSGSPRYGQCTRYLSQLRPGDKVTVSVRPSVMKLPPHTEQPIIMAGLGTGAAPFRAFLQARAVQKAQGESIGPLVYYFGSRYRSKEYLYGEELEAFQADGILTRLGLAFSRDQKHKVYIQDKISQDAQIMSSYLAPEIAAAGATIKAATLADALVKADEKDKGYFYLCGPYVSLLDSRLPWSRVHMPAATCVLDTADLGCTGPGPCRTSLRLCSAASSRSRASRGRRPRNTSRS